MLSEGRARPASRRSPPSDTTPPGLGPAQAEAVDPRDGALCIQPHPCVVPDSLHHVNCSGDGASSCFSLFPRNASTAPFLALLTVTSRYLSASDQRLAEDLGLPFSLSSSNVYDVCLYFSTSFTWPRQRSAWNREDVRRFTSSSDVARHLLDPAREAVLPTPMTMGTSRRRLLLAAHGALHRRPWSAG